MFWYLACGLSGVKVETLILDFQVNEPAFLLAPSTRYIQHNGEGTEDPDRSEKPWP